nr:PDDEXK nuclease domain-containing protein [Hymenobacter citatus]
MNLSPALLATIHGIITQARDRAIRSVDAERVRMYWQIGQYIFEEEQHGEDRAAYGTFLIKGLAEALQPQFGSGFSSRQLHWYVQFYRAFPNMNALRSQFTWTHYRKFIQLDNSDKREFYSAEAAKNNWSARQLERQVNSHLFERLLLSNDVAAVLQVAREEKPPATTRDIIKDPMILEFLGLKREAAYYKKDLETALITHLQEFMLELGNGFPSWPGSNACT